MARILRPAGGMSMSSIGHGPGLIAASLFSFSINGVEPFSFSAHHAALNHPDILDILVCPGLPWSALACHGPDLESWTDERDWGQTKRQRARCSQQEAASVLDAMRCDAMRCDALLVHRSWAPPD